MMNDTLEVVKKMKTSGGWAQKKSAYFDTVYTGQWVKDVKVDF